jgi:tetratricopeptide (TPR) repeat protein
LAYQPVSFNLNQRFTVEYSDTLLGWSGRREEALAAARVRELDPFYAAPLAELAIYYHQRDYKAMIEIGRKSVGSDPLQWLSHYFLAVGYEGSGRPLEAITEYQKAIELSEGDQDPVAALAHAYATTGRRAEAIKTLRAWQRQSQTSYVSAYI